MAEGRAKNAWQHTSVILAMLCNTHRDPKKKAAKPSDFNPFAEKRKDVIHIDKSNIHLLRNYFKPDLKGAAQNESKK